MKSLDHCLYDTDCKSPGERVCLEKKCECLKEGYIWDGMQKCQTVEFMQR